MAGNATASTRGAYPPQKNERIVLATHVPEDLCECLRIKHMFDLLNAGVQRFRSIVRQDRDLALTDDVAVIDLRIDIMNRDAGPFLVSCNLLFPCFEAGNLR